MTRYEQIKAMSMQEMAEAIIKHTDIDDYCLGDCDGDMKDYTDCKHPVECCIRWLNEEVGEDGK